MIYLELFQKGSRHPKWLAKLTCNYRLSLVCRYNYHKWQYLGPGQYDPVPNMTGYETLTLNIFKRSNTNIIKVQAFDSGVVADSGNTLVSYHLDHRFEFCPRPKVSKFSFASCCPVVFVFIISILRSDLNLYFPYGLLLK